ncbi:hypothetical protein [Pseudidiomarina aquimaris]
MHDARTERRSPMVMIMAMIMARMVMLLSAPALIQKRSCHQQAEQI